MTIALYSVVLNHHQAPIADELYSRIGDDFVFVETSSLVDNKGAEINFSLKPYLLQAWKNEESFSMALRLALEADVCIFGADSQQFAVHRAKNNPNGLSFEYGERWLKHGFINVFSPRLIKWRWNYMRYYRKSNFYKLCASAFAKRDDEQLGCYKGRHYKWGYFIQIVEDKIGDIYPDISQIGVPQIMWCSRFLMLKHPEIPIYMAKRLQDDGYRFHLNMYGDGEYRRKTETVIHDLGLEQCVTLFGNVVNDEVQIAMKKNDIFIFTSDMHEGWGAVANESLSNGCALLASDEVGSSSYLIKNGYNGYLFHGPSANTSFHNPDYISIDDLTIKIRGLLDNRDRLIEMKKNAIESMKIWSPRNAVRNLLQLIDDLENNRENSIVTGPCSNA